MAVTHTVEPGRPAYARLRDVVVAAKDGDPLAPVTVAIPSNYAGLTARRLLASGGLGPVSPQGRPGLVNVGFLALDRVAELLGAPALAAAGRRPLTPPIAAEALRAELAAAPGVFAAAAAHPATERSLARAFTELRACSPATLDRLGALGRRPCDLVRLYRAWRRRLAVGWYDEHDLADAAADAVRDGGPAAAGIGRLVVFLPGRLTPGHQRLVDAFGEGATIVDADVVTAELPATEVVSTVDADDEVRTAVRRIMTNLRAGTPLHRMAILYGGVDPYARLVARHLDAARVPWNGPAARTLAETAAGTALLGLLAMPDRNWRRGDVIAWLSAAPILDGHGRPVPAARWDTLSREAGVVEGLAQWDERLAAHAERLAERLNEARPPEEEEEEPTYVARRRRDLEEVGALRRFVADLAAAVESGARTTWQALAAWTAELLDRWVGGPGAQEQWPEPERDAAEAVRAAIQGLGALDVLGVPTDATTFRRAVERELDAPAKRVGRFGDGVFVAPVSRAAGLDLDAVFVVGLAEGTLPAPAIGDALLPEGERLAAGAELSGGPAPIDEQRSHLVHGLAAATRQRVLLSPRTNLRRGRAMLPSRWLLEAASNLAGRPVYSDDLQGAAHEVDGVTVVPSYDAGVATAVEPSSLHDRDLQRLLMWSRTGGRAADHPLAADEPALTAGLAATHARRSSAFTPFDGKVPAGAVVVGNNPGEVLSATSLEAYATCPRRFLFGRVLRVGGVEKPEEITRLSARDKGTLVHAILETYVDTLLAGEPRALDRLLAIADDLGRRFEESGLTGKPLCWRYDRQLIRRELRRFYEVDHLEPLAAELAFGGEDDAAAVEIDVGGRRLAFRGVADRVDRAPDGSLVVTDYKTGGQWPYEGLKVDPVDRGTKLQLVLYGLAAQQQYDPGAAVRSRYWFVTERADFAEIGYVVDDEVRASFERALTVIVDGIDAGAFPARPGEVDARSGWKNCLYCDFNAICPRDRARQWERKRGARELAAYVVLAEGEAGE